VNIANHLRKENILRVRGSERGLEPLLDFHMCDGDSLLLRQRCISIEFVLEGTLDFCRLGVLSLNLVCVVGIHRAQPGAKRSNHRYPCQPAKGMTFPDDLSGKLLQRSQYPLLWK